MTVVRSGARGASPEEVFRGLFARHYATVHAYCARRLGRQDAADAAADTFTVAWRRLGRVPEEPATLPWLYGVAHNVVSNHRRSRHRRERLNVRVAAQSAAPRVDQAEGLDAVLAGLRERDREILMLAAWEGLGSEDLGQALGCSARTAAVRLHRARVRLSSAWNDLGGER